MQQAALETADICLGLLRSALAQTLARQVLKEIVASIDTGMGTQAADEAAQFDENAAAGGSSRGRGSARKRRGRRSSGGAMDGDGAAAESLASTRCSETALWLASSKLLRRVVECCGTELADEERLELDRAVVGWLVKHGLSGSDGMGYVPAMALPALRLELYATLVASLACPVGTAVKDKEKATQGSAASGGGAESGNESSGRILPHLHPVSRQLFLAGSCNDTAPAVRAVCTEGLRLCTNLAQPRARPLYFPPPGSQMAESVVHLAAILPPAASQPLEMVASFGGMVMGGGLDRNQAEVASLASAAIVPVVTHDEEEEAAAAAAGSGSAMQSEERPVEMPPAAVSPALAAAAAATTVVSAHPEQPEQHAAGSTNDDGSRPKKRARAEPAAVSQAAAAATVAQPAAAGSGEAADGTFEIVDVPPDSGDDDSDSDSD